MNAYWALLRGHKPVGFLLLWFPTAWALWLANHGRPHWPLMVYFLLGSWLMRSAGCVMNDMADQSIDKHVARTRARPLASGRLHRFQALCLMLVLLIPAALILWQLPYWCWFEASLALMLMMSYPFAKRWIQAPQLILGLAFSMGIFMAYSASNSAITQETWLLFAINFLWVLGYDTSYAMMDEEDDRKIGVHSTAILFSPCAPFVVAGLQFMAHGLWLILAWSLGFSWFFYVGWLLGVAWLVAQQYWLTKNPLQAFNANVGYGLWMWILLF